MACRNRYILEIYFVYFFACLLNVGSMVFLSLGAIARLTKEVNTIKVAICEVTKCINLNNRNRKIQRKIDFQLVLGASSPYFGVGWERLKNTEKSPEIPEIHTRLILSFSVIAAIYC